LAPGHLQSWIRRLRRTVRPQAPDGTTDAQLLERFVRDHDEDAFELLVWRHGVMVLNVCRRVLRCEQDAEDAFQAAFLALACKAGTIGQRNSVGSWLYKVAYRVALRTRSRAPIRPLPEEPLADTSTGGPVADLLRWELRSVLDEEVHRLSEKYRAAFVLCHLEGQTLEAAARTLGRPPATIGTWLARARQQLRRRLARRGLGPVNLAGWGSVVAALPAALVSSTARAAQLGSAEKALAAGVLSAQAAALTKGALSSMTLTKWLPATALVLLLGLGLIGVAPRTQPAQAVEPVSEGPLPVASHPPEREKGRGVVLAWKLARNVPFYEERTTMTEMVMKVTDSDIRQTQAQTFFFRWTPAEQEDDRWALRQKVLGVRMDLDLGGNKVQYDSTKKAAGSNPLAEFYNGLVGAEWTVKLNEAFQVEEVQGRDALIDKLTTNPAVEHLLPEVLSEDALRELAEVPFAALREGPVRPGDSWVHRSKGTLSPFGECRKTSTYTYEGRQGKLDRIQVEIALKCGPSAGARGLPFKVKRGEVATAEGGGVLLFDRDRGRVVRLDLTVHLKAKVTRRTAGRDTEGEVVQTQRTTVRISDTNPLEAAASPADLTTELERLRAENEQLRRKLRAVEEALRRADRPKE
jgi:RNA polymerase sigma factor (sigma-70 family)